MPFGEEIRTLQRTEQLGYSADAIRQKFTGYERDIEVDLDFAQARYYNPKHGRFTSVDPMPIEKRHLTDPRNFNRYVYVANNPLKYIDPNGLEKIVVIVRTYIPEQKLAFLGQTFKGDFDEKGNRVSARIEQRIVVETDARKPDADKIEHEKKVGETVRISPFPATGKASGETLKAKLARSSDNEVVVLVEGNESNPLVPMSPGITYRFRITISSEGENGNVKVTVSGEHDGFPAYEIIIERPESGDVSEEVYRYDPRETGQTPWSLFPPEEFEVKRKEITIPSGRPR
ncbi:MAG: hypothetical protein KatS3mg006_2079 [Pyrinomonadaceae bacterium]|nr:MAG: hypothetical protein KatS3mg006_2079 [Pyrinomonadaceae bacterium]